MGGGFAAVLEAERRTDSYTNSGLLRGTVLAFLGAYLGVVLLRNGALSPPSSNSSSVQGADASSWRYESPEGLAMSLHSPFPTVFLRVHYWAGVALIPCAVAQKHIAMRLALPATSSSGGIGGSLSVSRRRLVDLHVVLAYAVLGLVVFMSYGGFSLRHHSAFGGFQWAMLLFVAPWVAFVAIVPVSGWQRWGVVHSVAGNALFKACIAVPLARTLGVLLQRHREAAEGYYLGIAAGAAIIGAWAILDTVRLVRCVAAARPKKA